MNGSAGLPQAQSGSLLKRLIFWDFPRATWQYDVVVAIIVLFIFLTPREWFRDQPKGSSLALVSSEGSADQVFVATDLLEHVPESGRAARAQDLIHQRTGKWTHVVRVAPIRDEAEQEIKGFIAYTTR